MRSADAENQQNGRLLDSSWPEMSTLDSSHRHRSGARGGEKVDCGLFDYRPGTIELRLSTVISNGEAELRQEIVQEKVGEPGSLYAT